ncbi:MAG: GerAB/ArcD/ProY family transporter [Clostridiaceae bacterium]|nr:GerAB/ArcD/ProY family transporter [Clostridiaceae bacterium]
MNQSKIGTLEAIMLILSVIIVHTVLSLPKALLNLTGSSTLINIIYFSIIVLVFVYVVCRILKHFPRNGSFRYFRSIRW